MNPLTQIKNTQKISRDEIAAGYSDSQSWHARFKHSAYIYAGGLPFELTEGDLLAIFAQYGEIIDVNLIRHQDTGKPRGFAFLAYEDQRSTVLAVDNLNGCRVNKRIITVDHVDNYKRKRAEMEGREESESEEEEVGDDEGAAEEAALQAALGDGAQVVSQADTTTRGGEEEDMPWMAKSTVHAVLNSDLPFKRPASPEPAETEEDPMLLMKKQKKLKKEKKSKKKKDKKEKKKAHDKAEESSGASTPPREKRVEESLPMLLRGRHSEGTMGEYPVAVPSSRSRDADSRERGTRGRDEARSTQDKSRGQEGHQREPGRDSDRRYHEREDGRERHRRDDDRTNRDRSNRYSSRH